MQVSEDPGFYVPTPPKVTGASEYAHVGSLDGSDAERNVFPATSKRYGSYIVRAPPARVNRDPKLSRPHGESRRHAVLDPLAEGPLQRSLSQQNRLSCIVTPSKAQFRPSSNSPPSASRKQRTLSRFTKELERYCVAASTNGRVPLPPSTPAVSESPTTLNTVTEFMPYHKQFSAAGLAVTSSEQMPRIAESAHPQVPAKHAGRTRGINVTRVQIDGSTVTPSEQETVMQDPEVPAVPEKDDADSAHSKPKPPARRPPPPPRPTPKSLLPWFLQKNPSVASHTHGDRKFSKDHIHPSGATPAEPVMTPGGLIDSYFDEPPQPQDERHSEPGYFDEPPERQDERHTEQEYFDEPPERQDERHTEQEYFDELPERQEERHIEQEYLDEPPEPQDERHTEQDTSVPSHHPSTVSSRADKPLPKQPSIKRRPIPPRSERRHMENTAEWPTAGVLIHDETPAPPIQADSTDSSDDDPPPAKISISIHSWTTVEDEVPEELQWVPPVPLKEKTDSTSAVSADKPATPPKDETLETRQLQAGHRQHPGHSICNKWRKVTAKRHRSISKPLPVPTTIREESETLPDKPKKPLQTASGPDEAAPRLSVEFPFPVEPSSSFERALDTVISKLDAMEDRRRYERKMDLEIAQRALSRSEATEKATEKATEMATETATETATEKAIEKASSKVTSSKTSSGQRSEQPASATPLEVVPSSEAAIEGSDKGINDRDILIGLKMAICAACDEDLDAWICSKTGLRLRRFLADLKAFESVSQDRRASPPTPISRRIRRSAKESYRMQAEQGRRQSASKRTSKPWSRCFGNDGQASLDEASNEGESQAVAAE